MTSQTLADTAVVDLRTVTASELDRARRYLRQTRNGIVGAMQGLSDAQWTFTPGSRPVVDRANRRTHHLRPGFVLGPLGERLAAAPAAPASYDVERCRTADSI